MSKFLFQGFKPFARSTCEIFWRFRTLTNTRHSTIFHKSPETSRIGKHVFKMSLRGVKLARKIDFDQWRFFNRTILARQPLNSATAELLTRVLAVVLLSQNRYSSWLFILWLLYNEILQPICLFSMRSIFVVAKVLAVRSLYAYPRCSICHRKVRTLDEEDREERFVCYLFSYWIVFLLGFLSLTFMTSKIVDSGLPPRNSNILLF